MLSKVAKKQVKFIHMGFCGGQKKSGLDKTLDYLQQNTRFLDLIDKHNVEIQRFNLPHIQPSQSLQSVQQTAYCLQQIVQKELKNSFIITSGFDHSLAMGSIKGAKSIYSSIQVFWIDQHFDCHSPQTSHSSNAHGMPLYFLLKQSKSPFSCLNGDNDLIHIGGSSFEQEELELFNKLGIKNITSNQCDVDKISQIYLQYPIWASLDIDVLDAVLFKSTGTPEYQGISSQYLFELLNHIKPRLVGCDLAEINFTQTSTTSLQQQKDINLVIDLIQQIVE